MSDLRGLEGRTSSTHTMHMTPNQVLPATAHVPTWRGRVAFGFGLMVSLVMALTSCSSPPNTSEVVGVGRTNLALSVPPGADIERVVYRVRVTFLESNPPVQTVLEEYESVALRGQLTTVLPCRTLPSGVGLNQVDIDALIYVPGREEPYRATGTAVFVCKRNADTPVNILVTVISQLDGGFVDIGLCINGIACSTKVDTTSTDGFLGVCPGSLCHPDGGAVFRFATECETVYSPGASFWICGDPSDWTIGGRVAIADYPIPDRDGAWRFGVIAFDACQMPQVDATITDENRIVKVWRGVAVQYGELERVGGINLTPEAITRRIDFAAELKVPPRADGLPSPELLLLIEQQALGVRTWFQTRFGLCDVPTSGVELYPGVAIIDVRRDGPSAVNLYLGDSETRLVSLVARCMATWDESGDAPAPAIVCGAPEPFVSAPEAP
jgi:hypothetical protein